MDINTDCKAFFANRGFVLGFDATSINLRLSDRYGSSLDGIYFLKRVILYPGLMNLFDKF